MGSVIAQTKADQSVTNAYAYSPYGQSQSNGNDEQNPVQYTARESDGTGLLFYRARYYDPLLKRFYTEDPIGLAGGINRYAYVNGDPINLNDPLGLCPMCVGAATGAALELAIQLIENGGQLGCVDWLEVGKAAAAGAVGTGVGLAGAKALGKAKRALNASNGLRKQYTDKVRALADQASRMKKSGMGSEAIARAVHAERRALGVEYKNLTPSNLLEKIYTRNLEKYGDKLGPTIDYLRSRGKTWEEIIESAAKPGGKDLGL